MKTTLSILTVCIGGLLLSLGNNSSAQTTAAAWTSVATAAPATAGSDGDFQTELSCTGIAEGKLTFDPKSSALTEATKKQLGELANQLKGNSCKIVISGTGGGTKYEERSWDRINNVVEYMVKTLDVNESQLISRHRGTAAKYQLNYRVARDGETGPSREDDPRLPLR